MLTLAFFATPGSLGASTAALGAAMATSLLDDRPFQFFSDRPHPHTGRAGIAVLPRSAYSPSSETVALYDISDVARPRTPADIEVLEASLGRSTVWLPIVGSAPQSKAYLGVLKVRPMVPLFVEPDPGQTRNPMIDDLCRQVLERGVESLGYTPMAGIRKWTQAWLDLLTPLYRAGTETLAK